MMKHYIEKNIKVMFPGNFAGDEHFKVIHSGQQLIDSNATLWTKIDTFGDYVIYGRLLPVYDGRYPVN